MVADPFVQRVRDSGFRPALHSELNPTNLPAADLEIAMQADLYSFPITGAARRSRRLVIR
ncbi:MAG: hypothetical protein IPF44_11600 [Betaproteobacteria bacterium]|nr:hypothetical protein [Betaproteobacteria bacterium]